VRRALPSVVAAAAVVLAACSGSSDDARPLTTVRASTTEATTSATAPEATTTTAAAPAGAERCAGSAVAITFLDKRAAAGTSLSVFEVRNTGAGTCRLEGQPGVEALDASGRVLATARRGAGAIVGSAPAKPVTMAPGRAAYVGVESQDICPDDAAPTDSDRLRVVLPDDTTPVEVAATVTVCPRPEIVVSPIRATQAELTGG
jgi:Protein of unknown function (DUF4232)